MTSINDYDYVLINPEFNDNSNNIIYENIVLYDSRLLEYQEELLFCLTENTLIVNFDFYNDTYDIIQNKLLEVSNINNVSLKNISLFQHNEDEINYYFINNTEHILEDVLIHDPSLNSWDSFKSFYLFLNDELGIINFDMLQCKIYSNNDWNTVFNYLEINNFNTIIRSSDDNTGHVMFDGDWILESSTPNVELIGLYFNERIADIDIILGTDTSHKINTFISKDQQSLYTSGYTYNDNFNGFTTKKYFVKIQLYNNSNNNFNVLNENEKILHVTCSNNNTFFTTSDNRGFVFGNNTGRMLGINITNQTYVQVYPTEIVFDDDNVLSNKKIKQITCTLTAYLILFYDGTIYAAGYNNNRELGSVPAENSYNNTFKELTSFTYQNTGEYAVRISSGEYFTVVLSSYGNIYSCGLNANGRTGKGTTSGNSYFGLSQYNNALLDNELPINIFTQRKSFFVLTNQNNIYSVGRNDKGQLGIGNTTDRTKLYRATLHANIVTIKRLFVCFKSSFIRDQDDNYYSLGQGANYLTLMNNTNNRTTWVTTNKNIYNLLNNSHAAYIQGRPNNASAINENGEVFSWGHSGTHKTMGSNLNDNVTKSSPFRTYISSTSNSNNYFTDALYGVEHSQGLTDDELVQLNNYTENYVFNYDTSFNTTTDNSGNIVFHIDTDTSYNNELNFVLSRGIYKITDISNTTPIALLNHDISNVYYNGSNLVTTTNDPSGNQYDFYSGTLFIYVEGDFSGNLSLYSTDASYGYMGTQNKIIYSDSTTLIDEKLDTTTNYTLNDISNNTSIDYTYDESGNLILGLFNENDTNSIIYKNASYNIKYTDIYKISINSIPRYLFYISTYNNNDNIIIDDSSSTSVEYNNKLYYSDYLLFKVYDDNSFNININIYDTINNNELSYNSFINYNENGFTNNISRLTTNGYTNIPYVISSDRLINNGSFIILDLDPDFNSSYYEQHVFGIRTDITYKILIPENKLYAIKSNIDQTDIKYYSTQESTSNITISNETFQLYSDLLYLRVLPDICNNSIISIYDDSGNSLIFNNIYIDENYVSNSINTTDSYYIDLSFNNDNELHYYEDSSYGIIPYMLDESHNIINNGYYSNTLLSVDISQTYSIINIPKIYPISIINNGYDSYISISGDNSKSSFLQINDISYTFYYGTIDIQVNNNNFTEIGDTFKLYSDYNGGTNIGNVFINNSYNITISNEFIFNSNSNFYIDISNYYENNATDVSSILLNTIENIYDISNENINNFYFTIANNSIYIDIEWQGSSLDISNTYLYNGKPNNEIENIFVESSNLSTISFKNYSNTIRGSEYIGLDYVSNDISLINQESVYNPQTYYNIPNYKLDYETSFNTIYNEDDNNYIFHIENNNYYNNYKDFELGRGIYKISDISTNYPLALINKDVSNIVQYDGSQAVDLLTDPSGDEYIFYSGTMYIYVENEFSGKLSLYSSDPSYAFMGTQNKFIYSNDNSLINSKLDSNTEISYNDLSGNIELDITYDLSGDAVLGVIDNSGIIYKNAYYNINYSGLYSISCNLPRYYFYISSNISNTDNLIINGGSNDSILYNNNYYYQYGLNFRLDGDISMNLNIQVYDNYKNEEISFNSFISYSENGRTNKQDILLPYYVGGEGNIDFNYQPFDYTISGNDNMYTISAELVYSGIKTHSSMGGINTAAGSGIDLMQFTIVRISNNFVFNIANNNGGTFYVNSNGNYMFTTDKKTNEQWSSLVPYYMEIGPIGHSNSLIFIKNNIPYFNSEYNINWYSSTNIYSHHFVISYDYPLTENSILYPVHYIHNGNNHSPQKANFISFYSNNTTDISYTSLKHYDWNEQVKTNGYQYNTNIYLYATTQASKNSTFIKYSQVPYIVSNDRFIDVNNFNILDLSPNFNTTNYSYEENMYGLQNDIVYRFHIPENKSYAVKSSISQNDIIYGGINESVGQITINDETLDLYDELLFLRLSKDICNNTLISIYDNDYNNLTHYDINVNEGYTPITIDISTEYIFDLSSSINDLNYYYDTSYGLIPYYYDSSNNVINNTIYSNRSFELDVSTNYSIVNIPSMYPIGIINRNNKSHIKITGDSSKKINFTVNNISYPFYYGDISINVYDKNFTEIGDTFELYSSYNNGTKIGDILIKDSYKVEVSHIFNFSASSNFYIDISNFYGSGNTSDTSNILQNIASNIYDICINQLDITNFNIESTNITLYFTWNATSNDLSNSSLYDYKIYDDLSYSLQTSILNSVNQNNSFINYENTIRGSSQIGNSYVFNDISLVDNETSFIPKIFYGMPNYILQLTTEFNTILYDNSNVFHIEDTDNYNNSLDFVLSRGIYKITDISSSTPIALLNKDVSNIYYDGTEFVSTSNDPSGNQYKFYCGTLFIYVEDDFINPLSLYSTNNNYGYMGTNNKIIYNNSTTLLDTKLNTTEQQTINDLSSNSNIDIIYDYSGNLIIGILNPDDINDDDVYSNSTYIVKNTDYYKLSCSIPRYYFHLESDISNQIIINEDDSNSIDYNGVTYYRYNIYFNLIGDLSMNIDIHIYDSIRNVITEKESFIFYSEKSYDNKYTELISQYSAIDEYINFKYQPFDYTISGNEYYYTISAELVYSNFKTHTSMGSKNTELHYNIDDGFGHNASTFGHTLVNKSNNVRLNLANNNGGTFYVNSNGNYVLTTDKKTYQQWSNLVPHFMEIGPISNRKSRVFRRNNLPYFNSNYTHNWFINGPTDVFSNHFVLSHDYPLTEDSVLFPVHYIWNGNNHSVTKASFITFYSHNTTHITTDSLRHYDWNEKMKITSQQKNKDIYLYSLILSNRDHDYFTYKETIPRIITTERFLTNNNFTLINFNSDSSNHDENVFSLQTNITYRINIPNNKSLAIKSSINQSHISYGGINTSTGQINIDGENLSLYDETLFFKLSPDISSNTLINIYDNSGYKYTQYDIKIASIQDYEQIIINNDISYTIDLSLNNDIHYYEDLSYGLIPYFVDNSNNINNNTIYSSRTFNTNVSNNYSINNIPSLYPITILNNGNNSNISITGDANKSSTMAVDNYTYTFYYGDVSINVYDENYTNVGDTHMLYSSFNSGTEIGNIYIEDASFQEISQSSSSQNNVNTSNYLLSVPSFTGHDDVSAVSMIDVSTSLFNYMFSVELDVSSIELIDASMTNLKFAINPPLTDISHLNVTSGKLFEDISFSYSSVKSGYASGSYIDQRIFKDVIRKISNEFTGSTSTADLFTNESQMVEYVQATDVSLCSEFNDIITNISSLGFKTITEYQQLSNNNGKKFYGMAHTLLAFILDASGDFPGPYNTLKTNIETSYSNNNNTLPIRVPYHFSYGQFITVRMTYKPEENVDFQFSPINYKCFIRLV